MEIATAEFGTNPLRTAVRRGVHLGQGGTDDRRREVALAEETHELAFWAPRLNLGVLHGAAWEFGRYPIDIYGRWIRQLLTFAFPVAVITTWPARTLVQGPELGTLLMAVLLATGFTAGTLLLWRLGLRRYTGATS
ncbi:ABC-2 family transporter protein [Kribbella monticola]|uniref:ABC-2 family transporter protein n=1 Tax=Kribbella monticola TaxID=2185285 RepID=UPI0013007295|nr:ABC-2 family transporter protein [Kribbella monticola]